jgi:hypothetical protein
MVKLIVALVLIAHGIGHSLGLLGVFRIATVNPAFHGDSWLLTGAVGPTLAQAVGCALWGAAIVLFAVVAGVVIGWLPAGWWAPAAVTASIVSLLGIALFPTAFPTTSTIGAIAVDVVLLAAVLWMHWAPSDLAV